jgi:hypothetical protein
MGDIEDKPDDQCQSQDKDWLHRFLLSPIVMVDTSIRPHNACLPFFSDSNDNKTSFPVIVFF